MIERITVQGTEYRVIRRRATAELIEGTWSHQHYTRIGAKGDVYLAKAHGGTRVFRATEYGDGAIGQPIDTHTNTSGYGVR